MSNKKTALQNLQFIMVGFILIASGSGVVNHVFISYALIILGSLLFIYAMYSLVKKKNNFDLLLMALGCESLGLFATAFVLYDQGRKYLPYFYLLGGIIILIGIFIHLRRRNKVLRLEAEEQL